MKENFKKLKTQVKRLLPSKGVLILAIPLVGMLFVAVWVIMEYWEFIFEKEVVTASLRNLFIVLAAIVGVPLAIWRSAVAKQQAKASERQAETGEKRLRNETYVKGAAMLGDKVLSVRLGGIYSLKGLANESPEEYQIQVMELLCAFVRNPPEEEAQTDGTMCEGTGDSGRAGGPKVLRDDVQTVVDIIVRREDELREGWKWSQQRQLDLRGASLEAVAAAGGDLAGALLHGAKLDWGNFRNATLSGARMTDGSMKNATVTGANMSGCSFRDADLSGISCNKVDISRCSMNSVDLSRAQAYGAKISNAGISGSDLRRANLRRVKLDHCQINNTDFSGANMWRANVTGTKFGSMTRTSIRGDERNSETLYCILTQKQLDEALAHPDFPPEIKPGTMDSQSGEALVWRGGCITEDQYPEIIAPQQLIRDGAVERKQGAFLEWKEMGVRLVPAIVQRLRAGNVTAAITKVCDCLGQQETTGCARITFIGKNDSDVDSCGITRWDDESRIWMLFVYQEENIPEGLNLDFFQMKGPESEDAWERWLDNIDWTTAPILESWAEPIESLPPHRRKG